jgi:hypothetical protein
MGRGLGRIERAAALTSEAAPFHAVALVTLDGPVDPDRHSARLASVAQRHPLLSMRPVRGRFEPAGAEAPELCVRDGDEAAVGAEVDALLNDRPEVRGVHPLRARLVRGAAGDTLVVAVPHYLIDATSLAQVAFDVLGDGEDDAPAETSALPVEARFPPAWRGLAAAPRIAAFAARQIGDELRVGRDRRGAAAAPLPAEAPTRHLLRVLSPEAAAALASACRRHQCTLYGAIAAATARVFLSELAHRDAGLVSVMSFRDLRRRVVPPVPEGEVGAHFAMPRHVLAVGGASDWPAAIAASHTLAESGRRGDAFAANYMAPHLIRGLKAMRRRAADIAVSVPAFGWPRGALAGRIRAFSGYVSVLPHAPPISLIATASPLGLGVSFMYLASEFTPERAGAIADAVIARLEAAAS